MNSPHGMSDHMLRGMMQRMRPVEVLRHQPMVMPLVPPPQQPQMDRMPMQPKLLDGLFDNPTPAEGLGQQLDDSRPKQRPVMRSVLRRD